MASEIKVDTVSEKTSANGVTIDGVNIKDSKIVTANSVDSDVYVDGSIDTAHIADLNVTTGKIAADAITGAKIADDAINSEHYTDGSIDTAHIADGQITIGKLATAVLTGATDIGAAIVDADLLLVDDGAGGTLRKTAASRLKTYAGYDGAISTLDIDGGTDIGAALVDADEIIVDDGGGGTNRRCDMSRVKTYVGGDSTPLFSAFHNAAQTISNDTLTQVQFNTESTASGGAAGIDSDSKFASNAFQPTVAGYYFIKFQTTFAVTDNEAISVHIRRNGGVAIKLECTSSSSGSQTNGFQISGMIYLDSDDNADIAVYCTSDDVGLNGLASGSIVITMFQGWRLTGV